MEKNTLCPSTNDQKLLLAASIAQVAATLFVTGDGGSESGSIDMAMRFYSRAVKALEEGGK